MKLPLIALAVGITAWTATAAAQTAESFEQLRVLVQPGETVSIKDTTGAISHGRVAALSSTSLTLQGSTFTREFLEEQVLSIARRRQDPLGNGALVGLAVGGGLAIAAGGSTCNGDDWVNLCEGGTVLLLAGMWGGLGAAIGLGIDALIVREHPVYRAPVQELRISVQPIFSAGRRGVLVSLSH